MPTPRNLRLMGTPDTVPFAMAAFCWRKKLNKENVVSSPVNEPHILSGIAYAAKVGP